MERFQYKWEYRKGSENVADALSRNPALADPPIIAPITALGSIKHVKTLPICILPNKDAYVLFYLSKSATANGRGQLAVLKTMTTAPQRQLLEKH